MKQDIKLQSQNYKDHLTYSLQYCNEKPNTSVIFLFIFGSTLLSHCISINSASGNVATCLLRRVSAVTCKSSCNLSLSLTCSGMVQYFCTPSLMTSFDGAELGVHCPINVSFKILDHIHASLISQREHPTAFYLYCISNLMCDANIKFCIFGLCVDLSSIYQ